MVRLVLCVFSLIWNEEGRFLLINQVPANSAKFVGAILNHILIGFANFCRKIEKDQKLIEKIALLEKQINLSRMKT